MTAAQFQPGDRVYVLCTDGKLDPGTIVTRHNPTRVGETVQTMIQFDDGTNCRVPLSGLRPR